MLILLLKVDVLGIDEGGKVDGLCIGGAKKGHPKHRAVKEKKSYEGEAALF